MSIVRPAPTTPPVEGNYTTWTEIPGSPISFSHVANLTQFRFDENSLVGIIYDRESGTSYIGIFSLNPLSVLSEIAAFAANTFVITMVHGSVYNKYMAYVDGSFNLQIYKSGAPIQTITPAFSVGAFTGIGVSTTGQYIFAMSSNKDLHIFKGA